MRYLQAYEQYMDSKAYSRTLNIQSAKDIINRFCKDFSWDDKPIYRGVSTYVKSMKPISLINPKAIDRVSANTSNYTTLLFDNSPYIGDFPKRSKSLICSSSPYVAKDYGALYRVIPFDGAKIGRCISEDFWDSFDLGDFLDVASFNEDLRSTYYMLFDEHLLGENFNDFISQLKPFIEKVKTITYIDVEHFKKFTSLNDYFKLLDPHKNHELYTYNDYIISSINKSELWTDSKSLLIRESEWHNFTN